MDKDKEKSQEKDRKPLGHISLLNNTQKPIYPMNDFFMNFALNKRENWIHLRNTVNIYLNEYARKYKKVDGYHYIGEEIEVETRYAHYVNKEQRQPEQDFKMLQPKNRNLAFIEFQNSKYSVPPIEIRAIDYTYLSIKNAKAEVSQIWFLCEEHEILQEKLFTNYRWKDDVTGKYYPRKMNTMFINLPKLAEEDTVCGELSKFLLGEIQGVVNGELKPIVDMFVREFKIFKESEEVLNAMTILEEKMAESREEERIKWQSVVADKDALIRQLMSQLEEAKTEQ